ncbi:MAG: hypothetical protein EOM31_10840 [Bacteroidia bacterium]|nr:hypothetical protein [Bacteroidia bacterium]
MGKQKLTKRGLEKLLLMLNNQSVPSSAFPQWLANELRGEGLLTVSTQGSHLSYRLSDPQGCRRFIKNEYTEGKEPEAFLEMLSVSKEIITRQMLVKKANDSKRIKQRTFKGFLVNCYEPIEAVLNKERCLLSPCRDSAIFIQNPDEFNIPPDIRVVGVENGENFQYIREQRYLFDECRTLFVCRYPQSKDLCQWLKSIPNPYLHFGDFDLAGISIFLSEFYKDLGDRATFFIPNDIEVRLQKGNRNLYDKQYARYRHLKSDNSNLQWLIDSINRYHRTYEQEGYIL